MSTLTQTEFRTTDYGRTQNERCLNRLIESRGRWVPMPELARVMGGYAVHSRISDLRADGHIIDQMIKRTSGSTHSFYKLL